MEEMNIMAKLGELENICEMSNVKLIETLIVRGAVVFERESFGLMNDGRLFARFCVKISVHPI